jgi:hypothetical protein
MVHADFIVGWNYITVNASKYYKYFALQGNQLPATDGFALSQLEYYGHRENDLVRLPDPTNVLKYPHIAMTGPAQRGYVASASSEHSGSTFDGYNGIQEGKLFDDDPATFWHTETNGTDDHRYDGTADAAGGRPYGAGSISNFDPTGINIPGEWVQLEFPHKLKISKVHIRARSNQEVQAPKDFAFYGSDTGSAGSWTLIQSFTGEAPQDDGTSYYAITSNPAHYKYILMLITRTVGTTAMSMAALQYFGTGVDSIPIQIGGGNIDKVANFRVYDKFIDQNQALEIWDAQKDEFGRAKSSMTLQKGRLGIGTDEPEGRLAVLDEPNGLEEFPPRAMTAGETYFEGHGVFKASSEWNRNSDYEPFAAFNKYTNDINAIVSQDRMWWSSVNTFTGNPGVFNGDTTKNIGGYTGVGLKLEMPYSILCNRIDLYPRNPYGSPPYSQNPRAFKFIASKDNEFWDLLHEETNFVDTGGHAHPFHINTTQYYKYFAIIVTGVAGNTTLVSFVDLQFFGTREQGQSVLHDGQLTLTKSLTVPRIGPALDADDTPRRDRLVVEYNTSTNPTFEGAVRDTSGRGNDGVFYGGASYDATEKALVFDGASDYVQKNLNNQGDFNFTVSCWFKRTSDASTMDIWFIGGNSTANPGNGTGLQFVSNGTGYFYFFSGRILIDSNLGSDIGVGKWNHVICTRDGNTQKLYLNGVDRNITQTATDGLSLRGNTLLSIGGRPFTDYNYLYGSISNFKLYDTALTAEEVKTLYDMGRCDEGHHVVNFSKTRVGIGLGDGEAPRGVLDVRGDLYLSGNIIRNTSSAKSGGVWLPTYQFEVGGSTFVEDQRHGYYHIINNVLTAVYRARVVSNSGAGTLRPSLPGGHKVAGVLSGSTVTIGWWARNDDFGAANVGPYLLSDTTNGYIQPFHPGQTNNQVRLDGGSLEADTYWTMFLSYPVE